MIPEKIKNMREYHIQVSNGRYNIQQFDVYRRLTAHAKLDNPNQIALWIAEQENYEEVIENEYGRNLNSPDNMGHDIPASVKYYTVSYNAK